MEISHPENNENGHKYAVYSEFETKFFNNCFKLLFPEFFLGYRPKSNSCQVPFLAESALFHHFLHIISCVDEITVHWQDTVLGRNWSKTRSELRELSSPKSDHLM